MINNSIALLLYALPLSLFAMPTKKEIVQSAVKIEHLNQLPSQLSPLLAPYRIFLIGETHGTKEAPAFCLGLIKMLAAEEKTPIVLALEISEAEQPVFDEFMRTGNFQAFEQSSLFTDKEPYGISSEAMVQLLASLRCIDNVTVICSLSKDPPSKTTLRENQEDRDFKWASIVLKQLFSKNNPRVVVLGGSFHLSLIPQMIIQESMKTMGFYLLHSKECSLEPTQVLSIDIKSKEVNAWGCFGTWDNKDALPVTQCGEVCFTNPDDEYSTAVNWESYFLMETSTQKGYNATLFIRKLSASKPFQICPQTGSSPYL